MEEKLLGNTCTGSVPGLVGVQTQPSPSEPWANKPALAAGKVVFGVSYGIRQLGAVLNSEVPGANVKMRCPGVREALHAVAASNGDVQIARS